MPYPFESLRVELAELWTSSTRSSVAPKRSVQTVPFRGGEKPQIVDNEVPRLPWSRHELNAPPVHLSYSNEVFFGTLAHVRARIILLHNQPSGFKSRNILLDSQHLPHEGGAKDNDTLLKGQEIRSRHHHRPRVPNVVRARAAAVAGIERADHSAKMAQAGTRARIPKKTPME